MRFEGCYLAGVPKHEVEVAQRALPGATIDTRRWQDVAPQTRQQDVAGHAVLSVMIHDRIAPEEVTGLGVGAIVTRSDGHDHLPLAAMAAAGVRAYHLEDYATQSVAQHALVLLLALVRRLPEATATTRSGSWQRDRLVAGDLDELTVGIIGTGRIGGALAALLDNMGVRSVGFDIDPAQRPRDLHQHASADSLESLLQQCQAVSIHCPLDAATQGMIGAAQLAQMPRGALLVNTARGGLVDHDAVIAALEDGQLAGFAADVLPDEPQVPDLPRLAARPDVLVTPHLGAHTAATIERRYAFLRRIAEAEATGRPDDVKELRIST